MKTSILYYSKTGNTEKMAKVIADGMLSVEGVEVKCFAVDAIDEEWLKESTCLIVGSPTYMANMSAAVKQWLEGPCLQFGLGGKLGGAFATADYIDGGGDLGVQTILTHMLVGGMLVYTGGVMHGKPFMHMGPVAIAERLDEFTEHFTVYGQRMATKAKELFANA